MAGLGAFAGAAPSPPQIASLPPPDLMLSPPSRPAITSASSVLSIVSPFDVPMIVGFAQLFRAALADALGAAPECREGPHAPPLWTLRVGAAWTLAKPRRRLDSDINRGMAGLGAFISPGKDLPKTLERVARADRLGFDAAYTTHIAGRDSLTTLMAYAEASERIRIGTGVVPIYSRTAATMAQTAATIDERSGGRMVLGVGISHRVIVEGFHGQKIERPVGEMREYVGALRAIFRGEDPPASERFPTSFRFMGYSAREDLPIYVAALSANMLRLAGEAADGVMLWLCCPAYIRETAIPALREGLERAGRSLEELDIVAAVPIALTDDPEAARARFRQDLLPYASLPFYRAMLEASGFGEELAAFDDAIGSGDVETAKLALSDRMLDALAGIGSADDVAQAVASYRDAGVGSPCVGGIPGTDFDAGLEAVGELITG